jgi:hypothetical protein
VGEARPRALAPDEILGNLLGLDPALRLEPYWGERAIFYNPGGAAPLGVILAAIKDHDGPNDRSAHLARAGVYRLAFGLAPETFRRLFGAIPPRPAKGRVIARAGYDPARVDELMPHPVYGWMSWVQVLAPTRQRYRSLGPLLAESLELARAKWRTRTPTGHHVRDAAG